MIDYKITNSQESKAYWMLKIKNNDYNLIYNPRNIDQCPKDLQTNIPNTNCNYEELLQFHSSHLNQYKEIIPNIKLIIAFNQDYSHVKLRICNFIKLKYQNIERCCYITTYDLILFNQEATTYFSNETTRVYLIDKQLNDYRIMMNHIEYLLTIKSHEEKMLMINWIINEFALVEMSVNIDMLKSRDEFLMIIDKTTNDYMLREGYYDKIIRPCLNIIFLENKPKDSDDSYNQTNLQQSDSSIFINICEDETERKLINTPFLTFITYHFPYEESKNYSMNPKADILYKYAKKNQLEGYLRNNSNTINITHRTISKEDKYNFDYQKVIGFGICRCKGLRTNVMEGKYNIGESSQGTILFNEQMEAVGIACYGNNPDYYYGFDQKEKMPNHFIPFNNLGMIYLMKRYLGKTCKELETVLLNDLDRLRIEPKETKSESLNDNGEENNTSSIAIEKDKVEIKPDEGTEETPTKKETDDSSGRKRIKPIRKKIKKELEEEMEEEEDKNESKKKGIKRNQIKVKSKKTDKKKKREDYLNNGDIYQYDQTFLSIKRKRRIVSERQLKQNELR